MLLSKALRWMAEQGSQLTLTEHKGDGIFRLQLGIGDSIRSKPIVWSEQVVSVHDCNQIDGLPLIDAFEKLIRVAQKDLAERSHDADCDQADAEAAET